VAKYKLLIKPSAVKELEAIPLKDRARIVYRIQGLSENPRSSGCEKLCGHDKYRIRQGGYRILYQVRDDEVTVTVVRVAKRDEA
jgi:mRNA interferase RelE/StbE